MHAIKDRALATAVFGFVFGYLLCLLHFGRQGLILQQLFLRSIPGALPYQLVHILAASISIVTLDVTCLGRLSEQANLA